LLWELRPIGELLDYCWTKGAVGVKAEHEPLQSHWDTTLLWALSGGGDGNIGATRTRSFF
jgi:hypothetical protein